MQRYKFNLWREMARSRILCSLEYATLEAAESDAVKMARALVVRSVDESIFDSWIEIQDMDGEVQSIVPIRLVAARKVEQPTLVQPRAA